MSLSVKSLGTHTELQCITYLHGLGYTISLPVGDDARYDFVLDVNHKLYKIQCKTAHKIDDGVYSIQTKSTYVNRHRNRVVPYTKEEIDYFSTFIDGKCYLIPIEEVSHKGKVLRFVKPKNNQINGVTFAQDYLAERQIAKLA